MLQRKGVQTTLFAHKRSAGGQILLTMAKPTAQRSVRSNRHPAGTDTVRRFADGPARSTQPVQHTVRADNVDIEATGATFSTEADRPLLGTRSGGVNGRNGAHFG